MQRKIKQSRIEINAYQTTNISDNKIKNGDEVKFFITIENKGVIEKDITIEDEIPYGLIVNSIKLKTNEEEKQLNHEMNLLLEHVIIKPNEIIELEINTAVDTNTMIKDKIENYVKIKGVNIYGESNKVSFIIELDKTTDEDNTNTDDNNNGNNNGDNNNNDNNQGTQENNKYNISGTAWIDENANGERESSETKIPNMPIMLINENTKEEFSKTTSEDGNYTFENIKAGKYIIIFQYDTSKYKVTTYQKEGVTEENNSDVINETIDIGNKKIKIAKTKTLELNSNNLENIDAGFIENKKTDLKLDKTINKVTVRNNKGTEVRAYNQTKLAKVEIDGKQIRNSEVTIEYNIAITNNGEVAGYVNEIIDYLPEGLFFNKEINKAWYQNSDGTLSTKVLANQSIAPNETKNITLILTKKMTEENTGTVTNKAKIKDVEINSNGSQADIIISIKTGRIVLYILLSIIITAIIAIGIYFIKRKVL
ncbi:MAG: hypothetical protein HFJ36_01390 [Clostridia bacterium]|nr:hypothetical protein [Clostridia bacterium]